VAKTYKEISPKLAAWLERQRLFFVATAPLSPEGHVNVSPKGDLRWFRILGPNRVVYLDFVGSGAETIAHAKENGRIVLMFCAFEGPPRIVRLHGRARAVLVDDPEFAELRALFEESSDAVRAVIVADVARVGDSCATAYPSCASTARERSTTPGWTRRCVTAGSTPTSRSTTPRASTAYRPSEP